METMEPVKYLVKFRLEGDPEDVHYRTLTFIWKLSFNAAYSRILKILNNRYVGWEKVTVHSNNHSRVHIGWEKA